MLRVEELEAALPSMTQWRAAARRSVDWAALGADLGTALPSDYRSLAEAYPTLVIDDFLTVSIPRPGAEAAWASGVRYSSEILRDLYEMDDTEGYVPYPEPGGLVCWANTDSGDAFYWRTSYPDPDAWPVVVRGANGDWSLHHPTPAEVSAYAPRPPRMVGPASAVVEPIPWLVKSEAIWVQLDPVDVAAVAGPVAGLIDQTEGDAVLVGLEELNRDVAVRLAGQPSEQPVERLIERGSILDVHDR